MRHLLWRLRQVAMRARMRLLPWRAPVCIQGGYEALAGLLRDKDITNVLLVSDACLAETGLIGPLLGQLAQEGIACAVYDRVGQTPAAHNAQEAAALYQEEDCHALLALGGGSAMDCAKAAGALIARPEWDLRAMQGLHRVRAEIPPLFAIPTTAGTGGEATSAAWVIDPSTREKYALNDPCLMPRFALLDPQLTADMPPALTAYAGMEALTHAVEAYVGSVKHRASMDYAQQAIVLIFANVERACRDGADLDARAAMQKAAHYAGLALGRTLGGNVHAAAHALGGFYEIPNGLAHAVFLAPVLRRYGKAVCGPLAKLADALGLCDPAQARAQKAQCFIEALEGLSGRVGIPRLIDGLREADLSALAQLASQEAKAFCAAPRMFSQEDFVQLYRAAQGAGG